MITFWLIKYFPHGMLVFRVNLNSIYHKILLNIIIHFIFYCVTRWKSALAPKAAKEIGLLNTSCIVERYTRWLDLDIPIDPSKKIWLLYCYFKWYIMFRISNIVSFIFVLLWSSAFITSKIIIDNATPFLSLSIRFIIVALFFFLFYLIFSKKK